MEQRDYLYVLATVPEASPRMLRRLLGLYGSPEAVFQATNLPLSPARQTAVAEAKKAAAASLRARDKAEKQGIRWISFQEAAYPRRLEVLPDAPLGLFVQGSLPPDGPAVGVVGARGCSPYGRLMAERFGEALGEQGIAVISGMARGIDGYAQQAALHKGAYSMGILGCGVDVCYPPGNRRLYEALQKQGGIVSEYPPGTPPLPHHFPLRNRLIAAFSDVLLVLEAREKSGSLITVDHALEQGKDVLALPGRVGDALSAGCLNLIRQGAGLLTCSGDIYEALGLQPAANPSEPAERKGSGLTPALQQIWRHMGTDPVHVEELLAAEAEMTLGEVSLRLLELESRGYIRQTAGGGYLRC